jgi:hypothetical protein
MVGYELWETRSGNLMAVFDSKAQALHDIASDIERHGSSYVETLTLIGVSRRGSLKTIASGAELAELARSSDAVVV